MRLEQLTFSRFIAAISIVIFHYGTKVFPFNNHHVSFLFKKADIGVSYFFVLSGFIMIIAYGSFDKINPAEYYKNRFARVYPLLALSVIPYILLAFFSADARLCDALLNLSTLQAWIPGKAIVGNYPLWSLTVEIFFFLCFPFLFNHFYRNYKISSIAGVVFLIWAVSVSSQYYLINSGFRTGYESPNNEFIYYFPLLHLNQFLAGNLAGLLFLNKREGKAGYDILIVAALAVFLLLLKYPIGLNYNNGFLAIIFIPLILLQAKNTGGLTILLRKKAFVFLGEISFGIYVLQAPVFSILNRINEKFTIVNNATVMFYLNFIALLITAVICYVYIERPLRNRIKTLRLKHKSN
jgi:peptidoglycan/LPS O-acetylase OafA/YrhL